MWGIVLGNRGIVRICFEKTSAGDKPPPYRFDGILRKDNRLIMRLLYYLIVGEAISLPMSLRNKTAQRDGRILSSPTGLMGFCARITEALCGKNSLPLFLLTLKAQKKKLTKRKRRLRRALPLHPTSFLKKAWQKLFCLGAVLTL